MTKSVSDTSLKEIAEKTIPILNYRKNLPLFQKMKDKIMKIIFDSFVVTLSTFYIML